MSEPIDISDLDKPAVLAALYNASHPQGMGFLHYDPAPMTREEAEGLLAGDRVPYFDYLKGRVMKVDLSGDTLDPRLYDRDNGDGAAAQALAALRHTDATNPPSSQDSHALATEEAAAITRGLIQQPHRTRQEGDAFVVELGLADVAGPLGAALDKVQPADEDEATA